LRFHLKSFGLSTIILLVPVAAYSGSIHVNGICRAGNCGGGDAVAYGASISSPFNFNYTVNSDVYNISGSYAAAYDTNGTSISVDLSATYLGLHPTATNDTFAIDVLQQYFDDSPGTWDGTYTETIPITMSSNVGAGSTVTAQLLYDGQSVGLMGPFGPGSHFAQQSANLSGLTGDYLNADYQFVYTFGAGTEPGAEVSLVSSVPEPGQTLPLALAGIAFVGYRWIRARRGRLAA